MNGRMGRQNVKPVLTSVDLYRKPEASSDASVWQNARGVLLTISFHLDEPDEIIRSYVLARLDQ